MRIVAGVDFVCAPAVALGSVVGALAGTRLLMGLSGDRLRIFFVIDRRLVYHCSVHPFMKATIDLAG